MDTRTGEIVLDGLVRIAHEPGRCVLVVTHDLKVAARCDRVLLMADGLLVKELVPTSTEEVASTLAAVTSGVHG